MKPFQTALLRQGLAAQGLSGSSPEQTTQLATTSISQPCMFMHGAR